MKTLPVCSQSANKGVLGADPATLAWGTPNSRVPRSRDDTPSGAPGNASQPPRGPRTCSGLSAQRLRVASHPFTFWPHLPDPPSLSLCPPRAQAHRAARVLSEHRRRNDPRTFTTLMHLQFTACSEAVPVQMTPSCRERRRDWHARPHTLSPPRKDSRLFIASLYLTGNRSKCFTEFTWFSIFPHL